MMNDYLSMEDDSSEGGYLGLDDPAPPTSPPAPPSAPSHHDGGYQGEPSYLDGGGYDAPAESGSYLDSTAGDPYASAPNGGYDYAEQPPAPQPMPQQNYAPAPQQQHYAPPQQNQPMQELSVQAPYLEDVHPAIAPLGGARPTLSSLVLDVEVPVEVYFGDASLTVEEFLEMGPGSVVELEHAIDTPIELRVRGKLIAKGQLVTINGNYGMRIVEMLAEHGG